MKVYKEVFNEMDFDFWGEALRTIQHLSWREQEQVISALEERNPDGMSATALNDVFAFDRDFVAQCLGLETWEELLEDEDPDSYF